MNNGVVTSRNVARAPELTVVIPTRNRAGFLERCLESLCHQTLDAVSFEVVVVDNGSMDTTADVAERYSARLNLVYLYEQEPGLHVGRHAGLRAARSDLLTYCDDDIEAFPGWLESVLEGFRDPKVSLVGGNDLPNFEKDPPAWLKRLWQRKCEHGQALGALSIIQFADGIYPIDPNYVWGCNFSVRRSVLEACGGFHPDGMPSELLRFRGDGESHVTRFVAASNERALFHSGASVRHFVPASRMTPEYFGKRYFAQGISDSYSEFRSRSVGNSAGIKTLPLLRSWVAQTKLLLQYPFAVASKTRSDLLAVELLARRAYTDGWRYHRKCVREDPELQQWIVRPDYYS